MPLQFTRQAAGESDMYELPSEGANPPVPARSYDSSRRGLISTSAQTSTPSCALTAVAYSEPHAAALLPVLTLPRSREFSHRVKSISLSTFKPEEVEALQASGGNEAAREIWLANYRASDCPEVAAQLV